MCAAFAYLGTANADIVSEIKVAEKLCKAQSEEMLSELGLLPSNWKAQYSNSDGKFNIEGRWDTQNGRYIVECELPYKGDSDLLEISLFRPEA